MWSLLCFIHRTTPCQSSLHILFSEASSTRFTPLTFLKHASAVHMLPSPKARIVFLHSSKSVLSSARSRLTLCPHASLQPLQTNFERHTTLATARSAAPVIYGGWWGWYAKNGEPTHIRKISHINTLLFSHSRFNREKHRRPQLDRKLAFRLIPCLEPPHNLSFSAHIYTC